MCLFSTWVSALTATHCNTLQHTATHCNTFYVNVSTRMSVLSRTSAHECESMTHCVTCKCEKVLAHECESMAHCVTRRCEKIINDTIFSLHLYVNVSTFSHICTWMWVYDTLRHVQMQESTGTWMWVYGTLCHVQMRESTGTWMGVYVTLRHAQMRESTQRRNYFLTSVRECQYFLAHLHMNRSRRRSDFKYLDFLIWRDSCEFKWVIGTPVYSRENLFEISGNPAKMCWKCTGTPVKTGSKFWQS